MEEILQYKQLVRNCKRRPSDEQRRIDAERYRLRLQKLWLARIASCQVRLSWSTFDCASMACDCIFGCWVLLSLSFLPHFLTTKKKTKCLRVWCVEGQRRCLAEYPRRSIADHTAHCGYPHVAQVRRDLSRQRLPNAVPQDSGFFGHRFQGSPTPHAPGLRTELWWKVCDAILLSLFLSSVLLFCVRLTRRSLLSSHLPSLLLLQRSKRLGFVETRHIKPWAVPFTLGRARICRRCDRCWVRVSHQTAKQTVSGLCFTDRPSA